MYKPELTVWFSVKNVERTRQFYEEVMGFKASVVSDEGRLCIVRTNVKECTIGFSEAEEVIPSTSSLVFEVQDIKEAVAELRRRGVQFTGGIDVVPDMVKLATFADPDGHPLMLSETIMPDTGCSQGK